MGGGEAAAGAETPPEGGALRGLRTRLVVLVLVAVLPAFGILARSAAQERRRILLGDESEQQYRQ